MRDLLALHVGGRERRWQQAGRGVQQGQLEVLMRGLLALQVRGTGAETGRVSGERVKGRDLLALQVSPRGGGEGKGSF